MGKDRKSILSFNGLEIGYGQTGSRKVILPPLNGSSDAGELIAVIGKNGIGKSTLLRTIAGLGPVIGGDLLVDELDINNYSRIQLSVKVGYISTEIVKVSNMTVYDLVSLGRFPHTNWFGRIDPLNHDAIMDALLKTGMTDLLNRPVTELSDGERQRAMIAMVLAQDAMIMVMDEPTAFLDITNKFEVIHLLHRLTRERKKSIIYSTHDLTTAIVRADKIWLLTEEGLLEGAPEDIMISGSLKSLFDGSKISYNSLDGSFTFRNENKGAVRIKGEGDRKIWTEKALSRAGYSVTEPYPAITIEILSGPECRWKCNFPENSGEFCSIYDLIRWINEKIITS